MKTVIAAIGFIAFIIAANFGTYFYVSDNVMAFLYCMIQAVIYFAVFIFLAIG